MGFLKSRPNLELWLEQAAATFRPLTQREYGKVVAEWRARFEPVLAANDYVTGRSVKDLAQSLLPRDVFVFNVPGYRLLPAGTSSRLDGAYGYEALGLTTIDFSITNPADAVIVDRDFTFTCLCTHEAGAFAEPQLAPATILRRD